MENRMIRGSLCKSKQKSLIKTSSSIDRPHIPSLLYLYLGFCLWRCQILINPITLPMPKQRRKSARNILCTTYTCGVLNSGDRREPKMMMTIAQWYLNCFFTPHKLCTGGEETRKRVVPDLSCDRCAIKTRLCMYVNYAWVSHDRSGVSS